MDFPEFLKIYQRKTASWSLVLLTLLRGVFKTQSSNYDRVFFVFFAKIAGTSHKLFSQKSPC